MRLLLPWVSLASFAVVSCATRTTEDAKSEPPNPFGPSGIPPQLRPKAASEGVPVVAGSNASESVPVQLTPEEEIVFTDPDNPEAMIPELSSILSNQKKGGPWEESVTIARQRAAREGKPLLIWFTDSARSPMCKALNQELFSTPAFNSWAEENLIRLRVDVNVQANDPKLSLDQKMTRLVDLKNHVTNLKKQYKILGHPSVLMLNPSGEVIGRYRGYKRGDAEFYWGRIKHAQAVSMNAFQEWRAKLAKKGYREWKDRKGRTLFAKLASYSNGTLLLIEPDGSRSRTHEDKLSDQDRQWIEARKKERASR